MGYMITLIIAGLIGADTVNKKIRKMDTDPNCSIKSDAWKRANGKL